MKNYDITIQSGEDFFLTLLCRDDNGDLIDFTGATIYAQMREYPEALDYLEFTATHNNTGGQILLTMAHEDTASIGYSYGVYDVNVEFPNGSTQKYLFGNVTVDPAVTKPVYGEIAYLLEFASEEYFPPIGQTRRVYFSQVSNTMYRWNGTAYVSYQDYYTKAQVDALLSDKSDVGHDHDTRYYTETEMDTALALKANSADVYSKSDVDTALSAKEDIANLKALAYKDKADFYDDIANLPSGYPPSPHNHDDRYYTEGEIDTALSGKSDTGHTHTMSDVTDLPTLGNLAEQDTVDWDTDIDDIPSEFPPEAHTHTMSEITDLPTLGTLAEQNTVDYETDIDNLPTLGALASKDTVDWDTDIDDIPATFTPSSHSHTTSEISDFPTLGTMSAVDDAASDNKEYVRKNGAWAEASGGGGGSAEWGDITGTLADQTDLQTALDAKANNAIVADNFSTSTAYAVGDLVIYEGGLYKFTSAHSAGAWNSSHVSAVTVANGFMKKTGDTMTGAFGIKNPALSRSATSQSELVTSELWFLDANDEYLAWNQCGQETNGKIFFSFGAGRYIQNTSNFVSTNLGMFVAKDGTKSIMFTGGNDANIWRNALGASSGVWTTSIGGTGGSDSGWKSLTNSGVYTGTIYYRRIGYFAEVLIDGITLVASQDSSSWTTLATIASGYRPAKVASQCVLSCDTADHRGIIKIETGGAVKFIAEKGLTWGTTTTIQLSMFYFRA